MHTEIQKPETNIFNITIFINYELCLREEAQQNQLYIYQITKYSLNK